MACGTTPEPVHTTYTHWGLVAVLDDAGTLGVAASGTFRQLATPTADVASLSPMRVNDCRFTPGDGGSSGDGLPPGSSVDVGPELEIKTRSSGLPTPFLTLQRQVLGDTVTYEADFGTVPGNPALPPSGLTVDVAGSATFPMLGAAPLPTTPPALASVTPEVMGLDAATPVRWPDPTHRADTVVLLEGQVWGDAGLVGPDLACVAADDGTYTLDGATRTRLHTLGWSVVRLYAASRVSLKATTSGATVLYTLVGRHLTLTRGATPLRLR